MMTVLANRGSAGTVLQPDRHATLGGILFGGIDQFGTEVRLTDVTGWDGGVGTTLQSTQRVSGDGAWLSSANLPGRVLELKVDLSNVTWEQVTQSLDAIAAAMPLRDLDTLIVSDGMKRQADVQLSAQVLPKRRPTGATISIPLKAPDPLRYAVSQSYVKLGLPSTSGGRSLPFMLPSSLDATVTSGQALAPNDGNASVAPVARIVGPVSQGVLTNATTGERLRVNADIGDGHFLDLDFGRHTALLDGASTRRGAIEGDWWSLIPGDNTVQFGAAVYQAGASAEIWWRSAWL